MTTTDALEQVGLPAGIHARFVDGVNGLSMHVLEAGSRAATGLASCFCMASRNLHIAGAR